MLFRLDKIFGFDPACLINSHVCLLRLPNELVWEKFEESHFLKYVMSLKSIKE